MQIKWITVLAGRAKKIIRKSFFNISLVRFYVNNVDWSDFIYTLLIGQILCTQCWLVRFYVHNFDWLHLNEILRLSLKHSRIDLLHRFNTFFNLTRGNAFIKFGCLDTWERSCIWINLNKQLSLEKKAVQIKYGIP